MYLFIIIFHFPRLNYEDIILTSIKNHTKVPGDGKNEYFDSKGR